MNGLLLYFLIWLLQLEGLLFNLHACSNCQAKNLTQAWIRKDFRGLLCRSCRRDEALELGPAELDYLRAVLRQPPRQTATAAAGVDLPRLLRLFIQQIEYHGEFSLRSKQYVAACR